MTVAHINRIGTAVPPHDVHEAFVAFTLRGLPEGKARTVFGRMAQRAGIDQRFSGLHKDGLVEAEAPAPRAAASRRSSRDRSG